FRQCLRTLPPSDLLVVYLSPGRSTRGTTPSLRRHHLASTLRGDDRAPRRCRGSVAPDALPALVRIPRLVAATAPAGPSGSCTAGKVGPADRAHRCGQDAGRFPALTGRSG